MLSLALAEGARPIAAELLAQAAALAGRCGLELGRCQALGEAALAHALRGEAGETTALQRLLGACCIGETRFLRDPDQFALLRRLLPTLPSYQQGKPLRLWSAACSTGEEAYSLAAVVRPLVPAGVTVLGTDVNLAAIACAQKARYRPWSLRGLSLEDPELAWLAEAGRELVVRDHIGQCVRFAVHNLVADPYPDGFDVIFCRNALMYFQPAAAEQVLLQLAYSLRPGGLLFLGGVDPTPPEQALFDEELHGDVVVWRRREPALLPLQSPAERPRSARSLRQARSAVSLPPLSSLEDADADADAAATLEQARALAAQRAFGDAIAALMPLCQRAVLDVAPYILLALVADEGGRPEIALAAARRACFLAPQSPLAHFLMGQSLTALDQRAQAARHHALAAARLAALPADCKLVPDGEGLSVGQLRRMMDGHS
jgi:chemotaxis protein methyltransferase CheR